MSVNITAIIADAVMAIDTEQAAKQQDPVAEKMWSRLVCEFQCQHAEYGLVPRPDGQGVMPADPISYFALDEMVRRLARDPANVNCSGEWLLTEAHRLVQEQRAAKRLEFLVVPSILRLWEAAVEHPVIKALNENDKEKFRHNFWSRFISSTFPPDFPIDKLHAIRAQFDAETVVQRLLH